MRSLLKILLFTSIFAGSITVKAQVCQTREFTVTIRKGSTLVINYFSAISPRENYVYIPGPSADWRDSEDYIQGLCQKGFSVASFRLVGHRIGAKDYFWASKFVSHYVRRTYPKLPISIYAWAAGAQTAVRLGGSRHSHFKNIILENPDLTKVSRLKISRGSIRGVRIVACLRDPREPFSVLHFMSYGAKVIGTSGEECNHSLSNSPEVSTKLLNYIDSDFKNLDHFFIKI